MQIAIVGDRDPTNPTHVATDAAFADFELTSEWLATAPLAEAPELVDAFDGVFISPCVPCERIDGALGAIRRARERELPLLGTCGGFQLVVLEFAQQRLKLGGAAHAEVTPDGAELVIVPLACSLAGQDHRVEMQADSRSAEAYRATSTVEPFFCGYGINPEYLDALQAAGMRVTGVDENNEPRIVELPGDQYFLATLFVPQANPRLRPHPLLSAFVDAARVTSA